MPNNSESFLWKTCPPEKLEPKEIKCCLALLKAGGAVDMDYATDYFPTSSLIILACDPQTDIIAGLGVIKLLRPEKIPSICRKADFKFDSHTPELGYVVVAEKYQGNGLSYGIVKRLCDRSAKSLFSTTDNENMKAPLKANGFVQVGRPWNGNRGQLTLWLKS